MADGMGQHALGEGEEGDGGADEAERAFEALRAEVAGQRRVLERLDGLIRQGQQARPGPVGTGGVPDYSPTLGGMAKELQGIGTRLDGIEAHPALQLAPQVHAQQVAAGVRQVQEDAAKGVAWASGRLNEAMRELREIVGSAHGQLAQQQREWIAVTVGAVLGFAVWWPLTYVLPWGGGNRLAATLIDGGGRWSAGQALMRDADRETWGRLARLYNACPKDSTTELCEAAMAVRTIPPGVPAAPEGAKPASPATAPVPSSLRGRGGTGPTPPSYR